MSPAEFNEMFPNGGNVLLGIVGLIILFVMLLTRYQLYSERKKWNNGICSKCKEGIWKSFDMDSQGSVGYACTNCNTHIWLDFAVWRHGVNSFDGNMDDAKNCIIIIKEN